MAKPTKKKKLICAARDCEEKFTPRVKGQIYHSVKCYNRESQKVYRERQREKEGVTA